MRKTTFVGIGLVLAAVLAFAPAATAAILVTLEGERTQGTSTVGGSASVECDASSSGTLSYHVTGAATGPYPGVYEERGSITVQNGLPTHHTASFSIEGPTYRVEGTKRLSRNEGGLICGPVEDIPGIVGHAGGTIGAYYEATITTAEGSFQDHGHTGVGLSFTEYATGHTLGSISTGFVSSRENSWIVLSPKEGVEASGTTHTVTARLVDPAGGPAVGERIVFTVTGTTTATGYCTTDAIGECDFTYQGPDSDVAGVDTITGCYDFDRSGAFDPGERCDEATNVWIPPATAPGGATGGGYVGVPGESVAFGFTAQPTTNGYRGSCSVVDTLTKTHVHCLDVTMLLVVGNTAIITGQAEVNGVATNYRIEATDTTEDGELDTFAIETTSGYVAGGVVEHGNVRVTAQ